jgi:hypothetical protein
MKALLALSICCLGVGSASVAQDLPRSDLFGLQPGRYQIVFSPHAARDTFLIDTTNGRVWQLVKSSDVQDDPLVWSEMAKAGPDENFTQTMIRFGWRFKEPSKPTAKPIPPISLPPRAN